MFRSFHRPLLAKVPYATLFGYNPILQSVFEAPADKVALTVELPGQPVCDYTYGRLQRDVVALSNGIVQRRELVAAARGATAPLSWSQPHKPAGVRSVFAQGERTPSCDALKDTGVYNGAVMCGPGYPFVVSLLALWATNHMAAPVLSEAELPRTLRDSRARLLFSTFIDGDSCAPSSTSPHAKSPLAHLTVRSMSAAGTLSAEAARGLDAGMESIRERSACAVDTVFDMRALMLERAQAHERLQADDVSGTLETEWLEPAEDAFSTVLNSADDIVARLEKEKEAAEERQFVRQTELLKAQHKAKHRVPEPQPPMCFDTDALGELNVLHRRWFDEPRTRPHASDDCLLFYTGASDDGAVHTHASVSASVRGLCEAWRMSSHDRLCVCPTDHTQQSLELLPSLAALCAHGSLLLPQAARQDVALFSQRLTQGDVTALVGDQGFFAQVAGAVQHGMSRIEQTGFRHTLCDQVRFCGCLGRLDDAVHRVWQTLSHHYIVTCVATAESGLALVQPLRGSATPPGMLVNDKGSTTTSTAVIAASSATIDTTASRGTHPGQLLLASSTLMDRYWQRPDATHRRLTEDPSSGLRYCATGVQLLAVPNDGAADPTQASCYRFV